MKLNFNRPPLLFCALLALPGVSALDAAAGNDTWTGGSGTANWLDAANWTGANTPPTVGDALFFGTAGAGGLTLNNNLAAGTSFAGVNFSSGAPSFALNGNAIASTGGIFDNSANPQAIGLSINWADATHSVNVVSGGVLTIGGVISGSAGTYGLTKNGGGTVTLAGANTYTGATTVNQGALSLDFSVAGAPAANIINSGSALTLAGGTLLLNGNSGGTPSQAFASTALNAGGSQLSLVQNGATSLSVILGAITRSAGGTLNLTLPSAGNVASSSGTASKILGTYATVGTADWAAKDAANANIVPGSSVSGFYTADVTGTDVSGSMSSTANWDMSVAGTVRIAHSGSLNTMRFNNSTGAVEFDVKSGFVLTINGFLVTPNFGVNNAIFTGPGPRPNSGGAMDIVQNNTSGVITGLAIQANGANTISKAGPGTLLMSTSTYTGQSYLNGGVWSIAGNDGLGAPASGATVNLGGGTLFASANVTLDNSGASKRAVALVGNGGGLAAAATMTLTVDGAVSGAGALTIGIPASSANNNTVGLVPGYGPGTANLTAVNATGTVILNSGANTYSGGTTLASGTLQFTSGSLGSGGVILNNGTALRWSSGTTTDISTQIVTLTSGTSTLDVNGNTVALANSIGNGGAGALAVKSTAASGVLVLQGANAYSGGTTVSNGSLLVNNTAGSGTGSGDVTVLSGATLGGTGSIAGNVTWQSGAQALFTAGSPLTISGNVTLNNNTVVVNVPGATPLQPGSYTLMTGNVAGSSGSANPTFTYSGAGAAAGTVSTLSSSPGLITLTLTSTGVAGTWDVDADGNWSDAAKWTSNPSVPSAAGDSAILGVGTGLRTVILDANKTVGGLTLTNANSFVVADAGNTLTLDNKGSGAVLAVGGGTANAIQTAVALNDNATVAVTLGNSLTVSGMVSNATGVNKTLTVSGAGTTILSTANSYGPSAGSVGTLLGGGGTLQVNNNHALGMGDLTVTGNSTLQPGVAGLTLANNIAVASGTAIVNNNGNSFALSGTITGGGITKVGNGTLALSGANAYTGSTVINAGVLSIASESNLGAVPGSATANNVMLNGGELLAGGTAALSATRGVGVGATAGSTGTNALLDAAAGQVLTVNGVIASAGNTGTNGLLVNSGAGSTGTVSLGGANTLNGASVIAKGTLQLAHSLALQNSTLNYDNQGGVLSFDGLAAATLGGLSGAQDLSLLNSGATGVALTLGGNNASTTYSGALSGAGASLTKNGTGTLKLTGNNSYSGATTVNAGSLELPAGGVINGGALNGQGYLIDGGSLTSSGTASFNNVNTAFTESSGTVNLGAVTHPNNDGLLISVTGGSFTASSLTLNRTVAYATAPTATAPISAATTSGFYVNGATANVALGALSIGVNNSSASVRLDAGSMSVSGEVLVSRISAGSARWSILQVNGGAFTSSDAANGIVIAQNNAAACNGEVYLSGGTTTAEKIAFGVSTDTLGGQGFLIINNGASLYMGSGGIVRPNTAGYVSTISLLSGVLGAKADWSSPLAMQLSGSAFTLQAADTSGAPHNITLDGALSGSGALRKIGGGTLALNGLNSYAGATTVSNGTLLVNGTIGPNPVTVSTNATLGGGGTIGGAVTLELGATLSPGAAGIGTLTLLASPVLQGAVWMEINRTNTQTADQLAVGGPLTYGGLLVVSNLGPALQAGDKFKLFNATSYTNKFDAAMLPSLDDGLWWNTSSLTNDGTIAVAPPVAASVTPASTNIECTVGSVTLTATVIASNTPAYQWYDYQTNAISGATNLTLTLTNLTAAQAGNYTFTATNSFGGAAAVTAVTVVDTTPPLIALNGAAVMTNWQFVPFVDPGATASDACAGTVPVATNGAVNVSLAGIYTLEYTAADSSGNSATNTRTVYVVALTPPTLLSQAQVSDGFRLTFTGPATQPYRVLTTTDLSRPLNSWSALATNTFGTASETYTDTNAPDPQRFYLIVSP